ncbi:hypothetical protein SAMN05421505_102341 [Sinosporangium album]|uniref:Small secreted domain n=1 Tax=Sinosporangium album TaxID=504805 RepID=A0A1G7SK68_9ACTN|nr:hypothetical protein [Sinosporangium album]SDG23388.1 hypothetical protein SAMN05421505_102341 [Sinosporangium album]
MRRSTRIAALALTTGAALAAFAAPALAGHGPTDISNALLHRTHVTVPVSANVPVNASAPVCGTSVGVLGLGAGSGRCISTAAQ